MNYAIKNGIELILITGDFIDRDNKNFEALGSIRKGIGELGKHEIPVVCVAGNHDHDGLPEVVSRINSSNFFLLGRGGSWEERRFHGKDATTLVVNGWSFPKASYKASPLNDATLDRDPSSFNIGLMHADYDVISSNYGPVSHAELEASSMDLWVLGHIHLSRIINISSGRKAVYPGSPQAMDPGPGERGLHGFYDIEVKNNALANIDFVPVSSVRYEELIVDISDCKDDSDVESKVSLEINNAANKFLEESNEYDKVLSFLSISLCLTGRRAFTESLDSATQNICEADLDTVDLSISLHKITDNTRYNYSPEQISQLATGVGAAAAVARLIQEVEGSNEDVIPERLRPAVKSSVLELRRAKSYAEAGVALQGWDDATIKKVLIKQSYALLDSILLNQQSALTNQRSVGK